MEFPEPRDEDDARVLDLIRKHGVFIQSVMGDRDNIAFGYSMGLTHNFGHPEIFISGLKYELHVSMINEICDRLKQGKPHLAHGDRINDLLYGVQCLSVNLPVHAGHQHVYWAHWLHGTDDVPLMKIVWPTVDGIWPWEDDAPAALLQNQEILTDLSEFKR